MYDRAAGKGDIWFEINPRSINLFCLVIPINWIDLAHEGTFDPGKQGHTGDRLLGFGSLEKIRINYSWANSPLIRTYIPA
jgi:hypothetical protein